MTPKTKYNPYKEMISVLDTAADKLGYTRNDYNALRYPERELTVAVPVEMDDGRMLKSTTIYIRENEGKVIGIFAINYDITNFMMMDYTLESFI